MSRLWPLRLEAWHVHALASDVQDDGVIVQPAAVGVKLQGSELLSPPIGTNDHADPMRINGICMAIRGAGSEGDVR